MPKGLKGLSGELTYSEGKCGEDGMKTWGSLLFGSMSLMLRSFKKVSSSNF